MGELLKGIALLFAAGSVVFFTSLAVIAMPLMLGFVVLAVGSLIVALVIDHRQSAGLSQNVTIRWESKDES